jgi:hypothetical protein
MTKKGRAITYDSSWKEHGAMDSFNKIMANAVKKKLLGEHPCGGGSQHEWDLVAQKMTNATGYPFSANVVFTKVGETKRNQRLDIFTL